MYYHPLVHSLDVYNNHTGARVLESVHVPQVGGKDSATSAVPSASRVCVSGTLVSGARARYRTWHSKVRCSVLTNWHLNH